jgi:hypothetical protein
MEGSSGCGSDWRTIADNNSRQDHNGSYPKLRAHVSRAICCHHPFVLSRVTRHGAAFDRFLERQRLDANRV